VGVRVTAWFTRRWRQLVRYGAVSLISTSISLSVLGGLVATRAMAPTWANIVATGVGTVPSFELNRRWVWSKRGRRSVTVEIGPFTVLSFAGLALSTLTVGAAADWASAAGFSDVWRTTVVEGANVLAFGSLWVAQFLLLDRVLFGRRPAVVPIDPSPARVPAPARRAA
jgi:putative flippase GtrA